MYKSSGNSDRWARAIATLGGVASSAIALSFPAVAASPGGLDPAFADRGLYVRQPVVGGAWALGIQDDAWFLGGGMFRRGFIDRLRLDGMPGTGFMGYSGAVIVFDLAVQPDGKVVAVGQQISNLSDVSTRPYVARRTLRLLANGEIDPGFNPSQPALQPSLLGAGNYSVVLATDGRIVVAGTTGGTLIVERQLPDGSTDASFATDGRYTGEGLGGPRPVIVTVPDGYRVLVQDRGGGNCRVLALTTDGHVDTAYGAQGFASFGGAATCSGIAALADGRIEVVGTADGGAFARRLTADGRVDTAFDAAAIAGALRRADAVMLDSDGASIIAGASIGGEAGIRVLRLLPDGATDRSFGNAGTAWVDVNSAQLRDLAWLPGRSLLLAGSYLTAERTTGAFAVRLLGDLGTSGPGALGFKWSRIDVTQQQRTATLTIRRTGGAAGAASVGYRTTGLGQPLLADVTSPATPGVDYDDVAGTLTWADGDASERSIQVPLGADGSAVEDFEGFEVELQDATGSIVGTRTATVAIAADGSPAGLLAIEGEAVNVSESDGTASIGVTRKYYRSGELSVKLVLSSGTAKAGTDFAAVPVKVTWADGETGTKYAAVRVLNDAVQEPMESFSVALAEATGGGAIDPTSRATINIYDDDTSSNPPPAGGGGGGGLDGFVLTLLGLAFAVRERCARLRA